MNPHIDPLQEPLLGFMWFCSADLGAGSLGLFLLHPIKVNKGLYELVTG